MLKEPDTAHDHRLLQAKVNATVAVETEEEHGDHERHGIFPLPYLMFFVGYCLVLLIDRVFAGEYGHSHAHNDDHHHDEKKPLPKEILDSEKTP
jgi:hypothetical protein